MERLKKSSWLRGICYILIPIIVLIILICIANEKFKNEYGEFKNKTDFAQTEYISREYYLDIISKIKDIEEMNGHFLMFNKMLDTLDSKLTEDLIKEFHYELKSGVFEDRANGYAIGDYKKRPNMIGMYETVLPSQVSDEMDKLLAWYNDQEISLDILATFHARYENIHPFQDGNGRTGRMILFRECLYHGIAPFIIEDSNRPEYLDALKMYRQSQDVTALIALFRKEQEYYWNRCQYFLAE